MSDKNGGTPNNIEQFKIFQKKINDIYKDEISLSKQLEHSTLGRDYFNIVTQDDLETLMRNAYSNPVQAATVSMTLDALDANYAQIVSYYKDMFYIRYTITPVIINQLEDVDSATYMEKYYEMLNVIDGMSLETNIPKIIEDVVVAGSSYIYADKQTSTKTVSIINLPVEYCRTINKSQFGTNVIQFNLEYFDQFGDEEDLALAFTYFPKAFQKLYNEYLADDIAWKTLDGRFATSFMLNRVGMPQFLGAMAGSIEYGDARKREAERNENALKTILINEIPIYEDEPIFDLDEVAAIQRAISKIVRRHKGMEAISVFGKTELMRLQDEVSKENKQVGQAYEAVFNTAGMNATPFTSDSTEALESFHSISKAMIWNVLKDINAFVNLSVNNLYKFKPLQAEITLLPITIRKEKETIQMYRENATFGLGKIEAVVATGVKQKHLVSKSRLEQELDIDNLLKPLSSAHTQSGDMNQSNDTKNVDDGGNKTQTDDSKNSTNGGEE